MTVTEGVLLLGFIMVSVMLATAMLSYSWPVTANLCHLNGHIVHGNLTVDASHAARNFTARFTCP